MAPTAQPVAAARSTDEAAFREFAANIQAGVEGGDQAFFAKAVDSGGALNASVLGLQVSPEQMARFRSAPDWRAFGANIVAAVKNGGSYRFQGLRPGANGRTQALFRMLQPQGAFNYQEYALRRDPSGIVKAIDVYILTSGEWISQTLRRGWVMSIAARGLAAQLKSLVGFESELAALPQIQAVNNLQAEGQHQAALAAWQKLPPSLRSNKTFLMQRIAIAAAVGERERDEAVDAFARQFPNDPGLNVLLVDSYRKRKQYDLALAAIEKLRKAVGSDAYLDYMRSVILYEDKKVPAAKAAAAEGIAREPSLAAPYWTLVEISLDESDYAETARVLTALENATGLPVEGDVKNSDLYAGFKRSDAYKRWIESRKK